MLAADSSGRILDMRMRIAFRASFSLHRNVYERSGDAAMTAAAARGTAPCARVPLDHLQSL